MKRKKVKKKLNKTLPDNPYCSQHIVMINDCFCFYTSFRIDIKKFIRFS